MQGIEYAGLELILVVLGPPMLGSVLGLLLGLARGRPGRGALGGLVGGTAGAWVGVVLYRSVVLPKGPDLLFFTAFVLMGLLLGALPLGCYAAGLATKT